MNKFTTTILMTALVAALSACDGDDGATGPIGPQGEQGIDGTNGAPATTSISMNIVARAVLNAESPEGAAEIVQYHQKTGYVYAINSSGDKATVDVLDLPAAEAEALTKDAEGVVTNTNMNTVSQISLGENTTGDANSISISNQDDMLAIAMASSTTGIRGQIAFYDISGATPTFIKNVTVGFLPDMVTFSPDGKTVVVANEGEPSDDYTLDPIGSISIISIENGDIADQATEITFDQYNDKQAMLSSQGMMFSNPNGRTIDGKDLSISVAMDLEPEYVAISKDSKFAYVSLQENNGLATVDLATKKLVSVKGFGFKDWSQWKLDASDKDDGINMRSYQNLYGMFQPDTIASYQWKGANFVVTANEGDGREYFFNVATEAECTSKGGSDFDSDDGCLSYTDEIRAEDLVLDSTAFSDVNNDDNDLGRLKVSIERGDIDGDGDFDQLYTYGARSFTIWDANGNLVFDSGDDMERITAAVHGQAFNNDEDENKGDTRSDAKGPEPEALALGQIGGKMYAFIGLERMAGIMVYDITNPFAAIFVDYFINRGTSEGNEITGDLAPEGMAFVPSTGDTPAKLIVGNEISGSVSVWEIKPE